MPKTQQKAILLPVKKILLYTDTPQTGGAELQMFLLAKFLDKEQFTPIIACGKYPRLDKWCESLRKEDIKVIRMDVKHKHDPRHYFLLKKILKEQQIDILHLNLWNPASCRYAYAAGAHTKTKMIVAEHDPFPLSPIKNIFKKHWLKKVAKIVTISKENQKLIKALYPTQSHKVELIYNGIDTTWWQSQLLRFNIDDIKHIKKDVFHAHEDTFVIISIAELHERKGLKYLVDAIPKVVEKYPNVKLVIAGEGKDRANLERQIKKLDIEHHVTLLGRKKDISKLLKSSNVFVLPSRREAFGLVNLEAMITPLPVIASKVGGIKEIIVDGETGILVPPENSESITKALLLLIEHPKIRKTLAEAGEKRAEQIFDAKHMAANFEKLYGEL